MAYEFLASEDVTEEIVIDTIQKLNKAEDIHGVLIFRPLPSHLDEEKILNTLAVEKDVDGITNLPWQVYLPEKRWAMRRVPQVHVSGYWTIMELTVPGKKQ